MRIRSAIIGGAFIAALLLGSCGGKRTGPIAVSAIGGAPRLVNPNLRSLDPPAAQLALATAQGLVRFDQSAQIEPALAQSWIVSGDGLRYTFRLARMEWSKGQPVTAEQVTERLRAAIGRASRNPLKLQLGAIDKVQAMTDDVLEISLKGPRPNFLQLLAQPEMAILRGEAGTGPYRGERQADGSLLLSAAAGEDDEDDGEPGLPPIVLRGESAGMAVARFVARRTDFVTGGTAGDLPVARVADLPMNALRFEAVQGLFGFVFLRREGPLADPAVRRALSMAIDRASIGEALDVAGLELRVSLVPKGIDELPDPLLPDWQPLPAPERHDGAARIIAGLPAPLTLRVAMPDAPGYRVIFAHMRRDWRAIGVDAHLVGEDEAADLRLVDMVAPIVQAAWYLRSFDCETGTVCVPEADRLLDVARSAATVAERREALAAADALLTAVTPFISIGAPVRWALVSPRLTGYQPNLFAQHFPGSLVAPPP